jgi:hypothetical protein
MCMRVKIWQIIEREFELNKHTLRARRLSKWRNFTATSTTTTATTNIATTTTTTPATKLLQLLLQLQLLVRLTVSRWKRRQKGVYRAHQQYFWNDLPCQGKTSGVLWGGCSTDQKTTYKTTYNWPKDYCDAAYKPFW